MRFLLLVFLLSSTLISSLKCNSKKRIQTRERRGLVEVGPPPKEMPSDLVDAYTRCGKIATEAYYVDDTLRGKGIHVRFSESQIEASVMRSIATVSSPAQVARMRPTEQHIIRALMGQAEVIRGSSVLVIGSNSIFVETLLLALGAANVTVIEYQRLTYAHPKIETFTVEAAKALWGVPGATGGGESQREKFSAVVCLSSFDHDGLGRYGDPLAPDGDLLSMDDVALRFLKLGGDAIFVFQVPLGPDAVAWNLHRRYGRVRLPLLLDGYRVVAAEGWDENILDLPASVSKPVEPVFILKLDAEDAVKDAQLLTQARQNRLATATILVQPELEAAFSTIRRGRKDSAEQLHTHNDEL